MTDSRPPTLLRDVAHSLPMSLLRAREAVMSGFRPILTREALTEQQWRVIRVLREAGSLDITALAERCQILPPSMTGILKRLEARGLTRRAPNASDQRSSLVSLTPDAEALYGRVAPELEACYAEIERKFGVERTAQLYALLAGLEKALRRE